MQLKKKLIIIGAGSLGRLTLDTVLKEGSYQKDSIAFIDDGKEIGDKIYGVPVIGTISDINKIDINHNDFIIAIANNKIRSNIAETYDLNYITTIHPDATISEFARIGKGNIILPNCSVDPGVSIENHVIVNKNSSIGHDSILDDYSQVSPGCCLGGYVHLKQGVFLGLGTNILPEKEIGENTIIGAGSTVTKDIPSNCTAVGTPCNPIGR